MNIFYNIALGFLQGITEFLPVSSSAHLVIAQSIAPGFEHPAVLYDVLLHCGTLLAVIVYFRKDVLRLVEGLKPGGEASAKKLLAIIIVGTIPTGLIGFFGKARFEALYDAPRTAASMLLVTGAILWISETFSKPRDSLDNIGFIRASVIGFVQGMAIIPGISRSGSTIAAATILGVRGEDAARFSFLLSIPAILGAVVLQMPQLTDPGAFNDGNGAAYAIGAAAAFSSGLLAIKFLLSAIKFGRFKLFGVYCWIAGAGYLLLAP